MKSEGFLGRAVKLLSGLKFKYLDGLAAVDDRLGEADSAALRVAMMVSALDGDVTAEELDAFETLAKRCRGYTGESAAAVLKLGLRSAGYLALQAKRLSGDELVAEFCGEALTAVSNVLTLGDSRDVRRAFVMWTAMAMADGEYSAIERACIRALREKLGEMLERVRAAGMSGSSGYTPFVTDPCVLNEAVCACAQVPDENFLAKAESLVAALNGEMAVETERALGELIVKGA